MKIILFQVSTHSAKSGEIQSWAPKQFSIKSKSSEGAKIEGYSPLFTSHSMVLISYAL